MPGILLRDVSGGRDLQFPASEGETLLSAFARAGIPVSAPCGGKHRCGKCKVKILEGRIRDSVSGVVVSEAGAAGSGAPPEDKDAFSIVLSCRSVPITDISVSLVSEDTYEAGVYDRILSAEEEGGKISRAGVALDIGTTTVSARLIDLETGRELDTYSALNRQRVFGADVMSRIGAARSGKTGELFGIINAQTEEILAGFIKKFKLSTIETLVVAANTTMLHLFVNEDPSAMGEIPFTPVFLEAREYKGSDLSLQAEKILLFPSISAFIGGDIVSGLAETGVSSTAEAVFFIDIGTNGEMALSYNGRLLCASAAAGPALEGAEISCGVGSVRGAVNKVEWADGKIAWSTIGGEAPAGLCGCGLIDAVAVMLDRGIIDETGAFADDDMEEFPIAPGVSLVNRDIRQFQLAKSAILSAIRILCENAGVELGEIKKVYVAGGLGFYIDRKSAVRSGLLPTEFLDRIEVSGNTSLKGAIRALLEPDFMGRCRKIREKSETMELASDPAFMDAFAENMIFPQE